MEVGVAAESDKTPSSADERQWEWWREGITQRKWPGATPGSLPVGLIFCQVRKDYKHGALWEISRFKKPSV